MQRRDSVGIVTVGRVIALGLALVAGMVALAPAAGAGSTNGGGGAQAASGVGAQAAISEPVGPGLGWYSFFWNGPGTQFVEPSPFTYSATKPSVVSVTDAFCRGDRFRVLDNGVPIGDTTPPTGIDCQPNIDNPFFAFSDPTYSHESFLLPPGSHSITIQVIANPYDGGGGYIRVDTCSVFGTGILAGTTGDDVICGSPAVDQVTAREGSDLIYTFGGADMISAGPGVDLVYAGAGNDRATGDANEDLLDGQDGNDNLVGGVGGGNALFGGLGSDVCIQGTAFFCETIIP